MGTMAMTMCAWHLALCLAENTGGYRVELRQCRAEEQQRLADCVSEGLTEIEACGDALEVCLAAAEGVERRCSADRSEVRACRDAAQADREDYDRLCMELYGPCEAEV